MGAGLALVGGGEVAECSGAVPVRVAAVTVVAGAETGCVTRLGQLRQGEVSSDRGREGESHLAQSGQVS